MAEKVGNWAEEKGDDDQPSKISYFQAFRATITFKFMSIGDRVEGLREQMISEQSNIGLLAALLLTIVADIFFNTMRDIRILVPWKFYQSLLVLITQITFALVLSTFASVLVILNVNELHDGAQSKRWETMMGNHYHFPIFMLMIAVTWTMPASMFWLYFVSHTKEAIEEQGYITYEEDDMDGPATCGAMKGANCFFFFNAAIGVVILPFYAFWLIRMVKCTIECKGLTYKQVCSKHIKIKDNKVAPVNGALEVDKNADAVRRITN